MSNDSYELIVNVKEYVKGRANEISQRLSKGDSERVRDLLSLINELEDELNSFDSMIDEAWENVEVF